MATQEVEYRSSSGDPWETLDEFQDYRIELGTQQQQIVPEARINTTSSASVSEGDQIRIRVDSDTKFKGQVRNGRYGPQGQRRLRCKHPAADVFADAVSLNVLDQSNEQHIIDTLLLAKGGVNYTLNFNATTQTFEYGVEEPRKVRRILRDIADESNLMFFVDPVDKEITVDNKGSRGSWQTFDTATDSVAIQRWDPGDVDTVVNAVTVIGTGDVAVEATAEDTTSISEWGRRTGESPYNYEGIREQSTANEIANSLLRPDPLSSGKVIVPASEGDVHDDQINKQITLTDSPRDISSETVTISAQTIEPGRTTLDVGEGGATKAVDETERSGTSTKDVTRGGSTYTKERIAADTITANEIDTLELETQELTIEDTGLDGRIEFQNSNINGVDTVEMFQSDSNGFGAIGINGSPWNFVFAQTVRPDNDNEGSVGTSSVAYDEMHAHDFITASPDEIQTVQTETLTEIDWYENPPQEVRERARKIGDTDDEIPEGRDHVPVELGTMANWLLEACKSLAKENRELEERVLELEDEVLNK